MKKILVICPTAWDKKELKKFENKYKFIFYGEDLGSGLKKVQPLSFISAATKKFKTQNIQGVIGTQDSPASILSAVIGRKLKLSGPDPEAVLLCQHKYYSRMAQKKFVPKATPNFVLLDPKKKRQEVAFPVFVKPVKSAMSILASKVNSEKELEALLAKSKSHFNRYVKTFNILLKQYSKNKLYADYFLAEQLLFGSQFTMDGFVYKGKVQTMGIVDSVMYPGTISFSRFEYPSRLKPKVQKEAAHIAAKLVENLGLNNTQFNIEMFYNKKHGLKIIEINPRMSYQFADLMEHVHGTNSYEILLALATGQKPEFKLNAGKYKATASFVLRTFEDRKVITLPASKQLKKIMAPYPEGKIELLVKKGHKLSDSSQDLGSFRYAIINLSAQSSGELINKFNIVRSKLLKILKFKMTI